jgi:hypothetical protein
MAKYWECHLAWLSERGFNHTSRSGAAFVGVVRLIADPPIDQPLMNHFRAVLTIPIKA